VCVEPTQNLDYPENPGNNPRQSGWRAVKTAVPAIKELVPRIFRGSLNVIPASQKAAFEIHT
jgi:hypothetical protein